MEGTGLKQKRTQYRTNTYCGFSPNFVNEKTSSNLCKLEIQVQSPSTVKCVLLHTYCTLTLAYASIAAGEAIPLLSVSVQPDTEDHEDDPASSSYACNKGWLLDHI